MTMFYSRSAWGALPANRESALRADTQMIFVHHSGVTKPANADEAKAQVAAIQRDHLARQISTTNPTLWADVAYNLFVGPGVIIEGRSWDVKSGATGPGTRFPHYSGSWDNQSVSICVLGNYQTDELDEPTKASIVAAFREARLRYGNTLYVFADRNVNYTVCCGDNLYSQLDALWEHSSSLVTPPPAKDDDMPEYIIRNGHDHNDPWLAVYPNGNLRHIGGTEAGLMVNGAKPFDTPLVIIDELDTPAYARARQSVGA